METDTKFECNWKINVEVEFPPIMMMHNSELVNVKKFGCRSNNRICC